MNPSAIEGHLTLVLIQWMIIIAAAWVFGRLAKKCHQPLAVGEIAAGILLGPSALGAIWPANWPVIFPHETQTSLQMLGKLGLIFLLFQVGMEFDYSHLRTRTRTITMVSIMGMVTPCLCGLAIGPWLHREFAPATQMFGFHVIHVHRPEHFRPADHGPDPARNEIGTHRSSGPPPSVRPRLTTS